MRRTKSTARRSCMVAASSSSSEDDISLGAPTPPTPPTPSTDVASSSAGSQCRGDVPSQWNQFTRKYEAQWKDDLSM